MAIVLFLIILGFFGFVELMVHVGEAWGFGVVFLIFIIIMVIGAIAGL